MRPATRAQFMRFAATGMASWLLNQIVLFACTDLIGLHYLASACASFLVVQLLAYGLNRRYTFASTGPVRRELPAFGAANLASFAAGLALMDVLVRFGHAHYLLANALASAALLLVNFAVMRRWVFRSPGS